MLALVYLNQGTMPSWLWPLCMVVIAMALTPSIKKALVPIAATLAAYLIWTTDLPGWFIELFW